MEISELLPLLHTIEQLKNTTRHSWTSAGRHESIAEHSWRLALMTYFVRDEFPQANGERLLLLSLTHDLGEIFTGDIPAFVKTDTDRDQEQLSLETWLISLPESIRYPLRSLFDEMEKQETLEARIVKALDRIEALLQHNEADLSTWLSLEYELNLTYGQKEAACSSYLLRLREAVRQETLEKIKAGTESQPNLKE